MEARLISSVDKRAAEQLICYTYSQLLGKKKSDNYSIRIGRVNWVVARKAAESYPPVRYASLCRETGLAERPAAYYNADFILNSVQISSLKCNRQ